MHSKVFRGILAIWCRRENTNNINSQLEIKINNDNYFPSKVIVYIYCIKIHLPSSIKIISMQIQT